MTRKGAVGSCVGAGTRIGKRFPREPVAGRAGAASLPAGQGLDRANWTHAELADHLRKSYGIEASQSAVQRFCRQQGIRPYRPTYRYLRGDPVAQAAAAEDHPYAGGRSGGRLDDLILASVRQRLGKYHKPVLLGECGLDSAPPRGTLDVAAGSALGVRHAIWASVVSGAMNGRMLWWQDGYDQFEGIELCRHYQQAAAAAASFVADVDFSNFAPVPCVLSNGLKGAAVGNDRIVLAWFRDARCIPPDWPRSDTPGEHITLDVASGAWRVEFIDTELGNRTDQIDLTTQGPQLRIDLPVFRSSLAVRSRRLFP